MKTIVKFLSCTAFFILYTFSNIYSAPAYPFPIKITQPNGDTISIRLIGDEFFHYATTEDGYAIVQDTIDGYYKYAIISENNALLPGKTKVSNSSLKNIQPDFINTNSTLFKEKIKDPALNRVIEKKIKEGENNSNNRELRSSTALSGTPKALIILVNFSDKYFSVSSPQTSFDNMLNQPGYSENGGIGSAKDFYKVNSQNQFVPNFVVNSPVNLLKPMGYYGGNTANGIDRHITEMIIDACSELNSRGMNFADFDNDKDGVLDYLYIFYSGYNEAESGIDNAIWSHKSSIYNDSIIIDGIRLDQYACSSELKGIVESKNMVSVGVFLHEFSHMLGLPDLYDADTNMNGLGDGVGFWCTMGFGLYLPEIGGSPYLGGTAPPHFGAMERYVLGWISPWVLTASSTPQTIKLPTLPTSNQAYFLLTPTEGEFFSLETRKKENQGWDSGLPGEGLFVYHNDLSAEKTLKIKDPDPEAEENDSIMISALQLWSYGLTNIIGKHQCMDMLRANNDPYYIPNGNPFPGTDNVTTISDNTKPGLTVWNGQDMNTKISEIKQNADGSVNFTIQTYDFTGIKENEASIPVSYFANKQIHFENIRENTLVEIYDISGSRIFQKTTGSNFSYNLTSTGQFIIKMTVNKKVYTNKILAYQ